MQTWFPLPVRTSYYQLWKPDNQRLDHQQIPWTGGCLRACYGRETHPHLFTDTADKISEFMELNLSIKMHGQYDDPIQHQKDGTAAPNCSRDSKPMWIRITVTVLSIMTGILPRVSASRMSSITHRPFFPGVKKNTQTPTNTSFSYSCWRADEENR